MKETIFFIKQLQEKGLKITPQRQEIIRVFLESKNNHLSAEDVHNQIAEKFPSMSLDTVYRNLSVMQQLGILTELNFGERKNLFEINSSQHHHHLVCTKCGVSEEIDFCPLEFLDADKVKNFKVKKHSFEIFGICANCME
ncbi:Fur family transcriptional regulator [Desulforamulus aquiferis]|uniref:Fur family transcriptional regulator n=1 Tax=Desulforamulus aquiferis TaxID=1397668 RepID=A0AAW7ZHN3_9FIRM|nr:Fur family transcriptional regulator [Desulforamulus aquiferis]MDO7788755.1 Fur family transcriptional regulator [Desulforamulus aquiferis]